MGAWLFWVSALLLVGVYVGYPALMAWIGRRGEVWHGREGDTGLPGVTIVIAARDEEAVIGSKLQTCLAQEYPTDALDVVVVSDGSTDRTAAIVRSLENSRVRLIELEAPAGKAVALNRGVAVAAAPIVVLTDARQALDPGAVRALVLRLSEPRVGAVSGDLVYDRADEAGLKRALHRYWDYEKLIRLGESRLHSCVGATGALYAIRRELWRDLPPDTLLDDVYTPMRIVLGGHRVVFEPAAMAADEASTGDDREYWRRVRTLTGNYQLLLSLPGILSPTRNPIFLQFLFHKLGRLASPVLLAGALAGALLAEGVFYEIAFWSQLGFWLAALAAWISGARLRFARPVALPYAFAVTQSAALFAFVNFLRRDWNVWSR